jgi:hypothetical protein
LRQGCRGPQVADWWCSSRRLRHQSTIPARATPQK